MKPVLHLDEVTAADVKKVGGKCMALAALSRHGFAVPRALCITTGAYEHYTAATGLRPRILLELSRKPFSDMRWEEIWDASLRIRNMFLKKELPSDLREVLERFLIDYFTDIPVVVRSSAPGEDASGTSFAGLHESYVNVKGVEAILDHIRLVWASLWSDAALLYRKELGLDVEKSAMAVVVQEIVVGDRSGVAFTCNPDNRAQGIIECVYGLNQGLVDGTIEPDRWILDRARNAIVSHVAPIRERCLVPAGEGVRHVNLPPEKTGKSPLAENEVMAVFQTAIASEDLFGSPQDMEWTFREKNLFVLQARPITTLADDGTERGRSWYLSLRRSFDNLKQLRYQIENEWIPGMIREAGEMAQIAPERLSDDMLADEADRRLAIHRKWIDIYWAGFIPFAHGARLFGQVYNDAVRPEDPYEFIDLLGTSELKSLARNRTLSKLAEEVRADPKLRRAMENRRFDEIAPEFFDRAISFVREFSDPTAGDMGSQSVTDLPESFMALLMEMAANPDRIASMPRRDADNLKRRFLEKFQGEDRQWAADLLDLAQASYRLRDDDNMYLGAVQRQSARAVNEGRKRLAARDLADTDDFGPEDVIRALKDETFKPAPKKTGNGDKGNNRVKARQLVGQPAGPGLAKGSARVVKTVEDLTGFKHGDILVCDAVDPNMTMVVPLAGGIVERRGGMLIHGAIIAREYGLACVTGVPEATERIRTGDPLTVDGYLGIVTIG